MSRHSFDPAIASQVGLNAAVIYQNLVWWCEKNAANERNIHEGRAWTYNSKKAFSSLFSYLTERQIRSALDKLEETGLVLVGCFNKDPRDRTKWYSVNDKTVTLHLSEMSNGTDVDVQPLPDSKPDNKHTPIPPEGDLFLDDPSSKQEDPTIDELFNRFWKAYPKKVGKPAARKAFEKAIKRAPAEIIIKRAESYAAWLNAPAEKGEFKPHPKHPQGWLNDDRWEAEELRSFTAQPEAKRVSYADRLKEIRGQS